MPRGFQRFGPSVGRDELFSCKRKTLVERFGAHSRCLFPFGELSRMSVNELFALNNGLLTDVERGLKCFVSSSECLVPKLLKGLGHVPGKLRKFLSRQVPKTSTEF